MKNKKSIIIIGISVVTIIVLVFASILVSCYGLWDSYDSSESYSITKNDDLTYSYKITDKNGEVLFSDENSAKEPKIEQLNTNTLSVSVQTGTGLSTKWTVYCDVENSRVSQTFFYVLAAQGDYVVYADYENGKHSIVVQNIFDESAYYKTYTLENCSPVAADIVVDSKLNGEGSVIITYLTGENYTETDLTISFP